MSLFQLILEVLVYTKRIYKDLGVKNSIIDVIAFGYLTVSSTILIIGLSEKIYILTVGERLESGGDLLCNRLNLLVSKLAV